MKKYIVIIISIFFMTIVYANAQESQKDQVKENTVQSDDTSKEAPVKEEMNKTEPAQQNSVQPENENTVKPEETQKEMPAKEKEAEAPKTTEKKAETKKEPQGNKEQYMADLAGNDEAKIITAAEWLAEKDEKGAVPQLVTLLKNDKRIKVRVYATIALGVIGDESCIPALNDALTGDESADVRYAVLLAISRINPAKSLDALKKAKETESDPYVRDYMEKMEAKWKEKK